MGRDIGGEYRIALGGPLSLELEIASEKAAALGRAGERVEEAIAALGAFDAGAAGQGGHGQGAKAASETRDHLVAAAAEAVWAYFVQREAMGFLQHDDAIATYRIPPEVLARIGGS
jgi:hypothetical protein